MKEIKDDTDTEIYHVLGPIFILQMKMTWKNTYKIKRKYQV